MYDLDEVKTDAQGFGRVIYLGKEGSIVWSAPEWTATEPFLAKNAADTFINSVYALVRTTRRITIYRFYGNSPAAEACILGSFWSPARPSLRIDKLGYSSMYDTSRADLAMKCIWNPMSKVVEATLGSGAWIFVGRAARQEDGGILLGGGAIQFILPESGHRLHLERQHSC